MLRFHAFVDIGRAQSESLGETVRLPGPMGVNIKRLPYGRASALTLADLTPAACMEIALFCPPVYFTGIYRYETTS